MAQYLSNVHKMRGEHIQCMNNHYAVFNYKGMKTVGVTDYTNQTPPTHFGGKKMSKCNTRKTEKLFMKWAQNGRCTSSICEQTLCKVQIKRNENFWSSRLHKLGTSKVLRVNRRTERQTDG